jgi:hypothetical protein
MINNNAVVKRLAPLLAARRIICEGDGVRPRELAVASGAVLDTLDYTTLVTHVNSTDLVAIVVDVGSIGTLFRVILFRHKEGKTTPSTEFSCCTTNLFHMINTELMACEARWKQYVPYSVFR